METLESSVEALRTAWAGALPASGSACSQLATGNTTLKPASADLEARSMSDAGLMRATEAAGRLRRSADALMATLAGEVARRSQPEAGAAGLAKREGYRNPVQLIAGATGGAFGGAAKLVAVGRAAAGRTSLTGEALPAAHPHVASALREGSVSVDAAAAIAGMLDRVAPRVDPSDADHFERLLAQRAGGLPLDLLSRAIADVEARLDPDGVAPREEELRAARSLTLRQDPQGMLRLSGALDPETAAPVMAAVQGIVTHALRAARESGDAGTRSNSSGAGAILPDGRSIPQLQADALAMIARHTLGCDRLPDAPSTSVVVRIGLDSLTGDVGHATIDGITRPVSAGAARRMAAAAGMIPVVLGGDSLPLDVGRASRGFTPAQRVALAERDGGCACCGLDVAYTEAHHIKWWVRDNGRTDLTNGVLLCQACHTRIHTDGWGIIADSKTVSFTPPAHIDPDRTRRLGGKARWQVPAGRCDTARSAGRPHTGQASPPTRMPEEDVGAHRRREAGETRPTERRRSNVVFRGSA